MLEERGRKKAVTVGKQEREREIEKVIKKKKVKKKKWEKEHQPDRPFHNSATSSAVERRF